MDRKNMALKVLFNGIGYNIVEVTLIAIIGIVHLLGGEVYPIILWLAFAAAALWTLLASTRDAEAEANELVLFRMVFITDFLLGALFMLILSAMTMRYGLQYGTIFFVAAIQNLRYSAMAYDWLQEERRRDTSKRNNLPPM